MSPFLTDADMAELIAFRHALHQRPEISGEEAETAHKIAAALAALGPDQLLTGLGGHGVMAVFRGARPGPSLMFRCELDALPIQETPRPHQSAFPGKAHLCGHDGHMATMLALARGLAHQRPARGRVALLFQPAEENGQGAAAVVADPRYPALACDYSFSLHNMPGLPLGEVALKAGPVNCASRGMILRFKGHSSHASEPEKARTPTTALPALLTGLQGLSAGQPPHPGFRLVTITHLNMGEAAFGITPGAAVVFATLRSLVDEDMAALVQAAEAVAQQAASAAGLQLTIDYTDDFAHCDNDPDATAALARAMDSLGIRHSPWTLPMRGSEDFGRFGKAGSKSAMFFLGAGVDCPPLHSPHYDFPDALIAIGSGIFMRVIRQMLG